MEGFNKRANLVACYLLILSILWPNKLEMFHEDTVSRSEVDGREISERFRQFYFFTKRTTLLVKNSIKTKFLLSFSVEQNTKLLPFLSMLVV